MTALTSSVSPKGQVTIPQSIRHLLGIKPKDKVAFIVADGHIEIVAVRSELEAIYQSVPALPVQRTWREITEIAAEEHAVEAAREGF